MSGRGQGRGFGLTRRPGRGASRPTTGSQPWIQVQNQYNPSVTDMVDGPPPQHRETVSNKYTIYCDIAMGHNSKKQPSLSFLVKHLLNILRSGDETTSILPFDDKHQANSLCHSLHVPERPNELTIYFPDFKNYLKRYRTKCRSTTTIPMWMLKGKVIDQLKSNDFWVNSTTLKSHVSERCVFFSLRTPLSGTTQRF